MADCPWSHADKGPCVLAEHHSEPHQFRADVIPMRSERASGALRHVASMVDATLRSYQDARDVASEEGTPLPADIDERIVAALVQADCLLRTHSALRAARESRRPNSGLQRVMPPSDGDRR